MSVASGNKVLPTKIGLIQTKRSLRTSRTVYKILEDKREVLLKRLDEMINEAQKSRDDMWDPLSEAYRQLYNSYLELGPAKLESVATSTPPTVDVSVNVRTIVSVSVPTMKITQKNVGLTYGFADTNESMDKATRMMRNVLPGILKAAEVENAIFRLATELEKTQRLLERSRVHHHSRIPGHDQVHLCDSGGEGTRRVRSIKAGEAHPGKEEGTSGRSRNELH